MMLENSPHGELPELLWGDHLIDSLMEFGPANSGPMGGLTSVTFQEMEAWARMTKTEIPGYEAVLLKRLSQDYVAQHRISTDPQCPMPTSDEEEAKDYVGENFKALLKSQKG